MTMIWFRHALNHIQNKMQKDLNHINNDDHLYKPADKTNNYYRVKPADYEQLLEKSIHRNNKNYKKTDREQLTKEPHLPKKAEIFVYALNYAVSLFPFYSLGDVVSLPRPRLY